MATKKKKTKAKPKAKPPTKAQIAAQAKAMIDDALAPPTPGKKRAPQFPHAAEMSDAVWHLSRVVNKAVQKVYDNVLSQTIIKLQHARRKNIV